MGAAAGLFVEAFDSNHSDAAILDWGFDLKGSEQIGPCGEFSFCQIEGAQGVAVTLFAKLAWQRGGVTRHKRSE